MLTLEGSQRYRSIDICLTEITLLEKKAEVSIAAMLRKRSFLKTLGEDELNYWGYFISYFLKELVGYIVRTSYLIDIDIL